MSNNKIAIVTGANKGLGFAIVKGLCEKFDGIVYLTSRDEERGRQATEHLAKLSLKPVYHQLDINDEESVGRFCSHIRDRGLVDILINNAGVLFLKDAPEPRLLQAERTISVNFFSLVNFTEAMLPLMRNGGNILNISSSSGHLSRIPSDQIRARISSMELRLKDLKDIMNSYVEAVREGTDLESGWGESPYVVSKVGVNAYTFMLNRRLSGRGIRVNCVHPGYVISDMTRGSGSVTPAQAAELPLRLALEPWGGGLYVWHNGATVQWDGPDPRGSIDGMKLL